MITQRLPQPGKMGWQPGMGTQPHRFLARAVLTPMAIDIRYWNANGWWGDQGNTSECTIYSWLHVIADGPITHRGTQPIDNPTRLYQLGQQIDGTPLRDIDSGLSSDAAAQVMKRQGYIGEYRWALTVDDVVDCVANAGPGTLGSWWRSGMDTPDAHSAQIAYTGVVRGGHQYVVDGVNKHLELIRIKNSWGRGWGKHGFAYMTFDTLAAILADGGEFCIARELLNRTQPL